MMSFNKALLSGFFLLMVSTVLTAGTSCKQQEVKPLLYVNASKKALEVQKKLNQLNPQVALIARVGADLHQYGLHYSHLAFAVKNYPKAPGKWTIIHLLNECNTSHSSLHKQGLMNFFLDDLYTLDYEITIPNHETQIKLYQALQAKKLHALHNRQYSMLAYPFSTKYQNSNQWILEVTAAALSSTSVTSRSSAQHYLLKTGYKPSLIKINMLSKLGASMFNNHIQFDDHPSQEKRSNQFSTVSVISVVNYLRRQGIISFIFNG